MRCSDNPRSTDLEREGNGPINERVAVVVVSETHFDLVFDISTPNYPGMYVLQLPNGLRGAEMTSGSNSVASITCVAMLSWPLNASTHKILTPERTCHKILTPLPFHP